MGQIMLIRHGETTWSASRRHTSYTDLELTPDGARQARALGAALAAQRFAAVLTSPRIRALRTAQLAGLTVTGTDEDLTEWNYGEYEGLTTAEIQEDQPGWSVWSDGCPGGESPSEVGERVDRMLSRLHPLLDQGSVALVGHAHTLRVLGARWVGLPPSAGALLRLDTATLSLLGHEHGRRVILRWNQPAPTAPA
ncbi:histidine phosphatase family protein [Micromonospora endophytica]|uniref:Histidine phosphatase family protein n=1 Tax=Micromonospora endophytica TaxID=515350 RepID=A0A2W2DS04_9ACTN|nr:histidine phosphatase family protein [Micromonospora endophytica]PZF99896.1 histidine phosphatase family protein [Micromonospora endophytica]RIW49517.1 histidine phosphatase family protein [Micromonospora endophytica]BCJ62566.1 putative phosphoglycerate mutase EntD [Micromonospora endophytica]